MQVGDLVKIAHPRTEAATNARGLVVGFSNDGRNPRILWPEGHASLETLSLLEVVSASR